MLFRVHTTAFNAKTGALISNPEGNVRVECLDTVTNLIFYGAKNPYDIKRKYEGFWNSERGKEVVSVISVEKITKSQWDDKIIWVNSIFHI